MIKKILFIAIVLAVLTQVSSAQNYTFRILASKGKNMVKKSGSRWETLKIGAKLNKGEKVKLATNGYLGFIHSSGKTMELKKEGVYEITKLSSNLGSSTRNIASKYADFVMSKMSPKKKEENRRKYASVTGAGERGLRNDPINIYMPQSVTVFNNYAIIRWDAIKKDAVYTINFKNIFEEKVLTVETSNSFYKVNFDNEEIKNAVVENLIIVNVSLKDNESIASKNAAIELMSDDDEKTIEYKFELDKLETNIGNNTSINSLIVAEFYEEKGLVLDASTSYENAIKLSPNVRYFQEVYDEFLIRNKLKNPSNIKTK